MWERGARDQPPFLCFVLQPDWTTGPQSVLACGLCIMDLRTLPQLPEVFSPFNVQLQWKGALPPSLPTWRPLHYVPLTRVPLRLSTLNCTSCDQHVSCTRLRAPPCPGLV